MTDGMTQSSDLAFLQHALRLAARGLGRTAPNPTVGCVIVKDNHVIGIGRTADGGRPHAETEALAQASDAARGATAYVTLEPCSHFGKTPPCAEALIQAGIARVVIGCGDPDPRVAGKGIAMLQAAGVEVVSLNDAACAELNRGFFRRITHKLPYVSIKLATSSDYFMARNDGGSPWLTSAFARAHGQRIRGQHDAMLTGIGTVLADDPLLTVRAPNAPHPSLVRVVADRSLRLPLDSKLVKTAEQFPLWVITTAEGVEQAASHATDLRERGAKIIALTDERGDPLPPRGRAGVRPNEAPAETHNGPHLTSPLQGEGRAASSLQPKTILETLAKEGLTRVLIEAGPKISAAFLASGLVDTLHHYQALRALGNTGAAAINALEGHLARATRTETRKLGEDSYTRYELK